MPLTTGWLQRLFSIMMTELGYNAKLYSLHSLRRGGATTSYQAGVDYTLIKRQGTWASDALWSYISPLTTVASPLPLRLAQAAI